MNKDEKNEAWPGVKMELDQTTGYYYYDVPENLSTGKVIFTQDKTTKTNRYPAEKEPGLDVSGTMLFKEGNTLISYEIPQSPTPVPTTTVVATTVATEPATETPEPIVSQAPVISETPTQDPTVTQETPVTAKPTFTQIPNGSSFPMTTQSARPTQAAQLTPVPTERLSSNDLDQIQHVATQSPSIAASSSPNNANLAPVIPSTTQAENTAVPTIPGNTSATNKKTNSQENDLYFDPTSKGIYRVIRSDADGTGTVEYYKNGSNACKQITIPNQITINHTTYNVTRIGKNALKGNKVVKKVTIGKNVTRIGANAFKSCSKITVIKIKSTKISTIGKNAFGGLSKKVQINVPKDQRVTYAKLLKKAKLNKKAIIK